MIGRSIRTWAGLLSLLLLALGQVSFSIAPTPCGPECRATCAGACCAAPETGETATCDDEELGPCCQRTDDDSSAVRVRSACSCGHGKWRTLGWAGAVALAPTLSKWTVAVPENEFERVARATRPSGRSPAPEPRPPRA